MNWKTKEVKVKDLNKFDKLKICSRYSCNECPFQNQIGYDSSGKRILKNCPDLSIEDPERVVQVPVELG